jgi:hypothetical protein
MSKWFLSFACILIVIIGTITLLDMHEFYLMETIFMSIVGILTGAFGVFLFLQSNIINRRKSYLIKYGSIEISKQYGIQLINNKKDRITTMDLIHLVHDKNEKIDNVKAVHKSFLRHFVIGDKGYYVFVEIIGKQKMIFYPIYDLVPRKYHFTFEQMISNFTS